MGASSTCSEESLRDDPLFWQTLRDYHTTYAYSNAVTTQFVASVNASTGQDLSWFFDPWLYGSGHPIYEYGWSSTDLGGGQHQVDVVVNQIQNNGTIYDMPVDFRVQTSGGDFDFNERISSVSQLVSFVVTSPPTGLVVDPDDWILDEQLLAPTSVDFGPEAAAAQALALQVPRPNPFRSRTEIRYFLPTSGSVDIVVHDVAGRRVRTLTQGPELPGSRRIWWDRRSDDGTRVSAGVYWVRLDSTRGGSPDGKG